MTELKILMRSDLNMRKGKMAAQSGHAAMMVVVSRFRNEPDHLTMSAADAKDLGDFLLNPKADVSLVFGENDLVEGIGDEYEYHLVIDNGATEFKGVKTLTCGAGGIFQERVLFDPVVSANGDNQSTARQYFIFSRETEFNKKTTCIMASIGAVMQIEKLLIPDPQGSGDFILPRAGNEHFFKWILHGYPKIGLQAPTHDELVGLHARLVGEGYGSSLIDHEGHMMLCVGPEYTANLSPFTGGLKLL